MTILTYSEQLSRDLSLYEELGKLEEGQKLEVSGKDKIQVSCGDNIYWSSWAVQSLFRNAQSLSGVKASRQDTVNFIKVLGERTVRNIENFQNDLFIKSFDQEFLNGSCQTIHNLQEKVTQAVLGIGNLCLTYSEDVEIVGLLGLEKNLLIRKILPEITTCASTVTVQKRILEEELIKRGEESSRLRNEISKFDEELENSVCLNVPFSGALGLLGEVECKTK
ncbi:MAG: hypothetical protein ACI9S8_000236 [Chlamydiales bacterium]|jgi:hypothetical protein